MMKAKATFRGHLMAAVVILLGAVAVTGALSPAASDELRPLLQAMGIISCTSNGPCLEGKNAGIGAGVKGISAKGNGVVGLTTFNSTSSGNGQAGISGLDNSTSGTFDAGVKGTSTIGIGVAGTSTNTGIGVLGISVGGAGVVGQSISFMGVYAKGGNGPYPALSVNGGENNPDLIYACRLGGPDPCGIINGQPVPEFDVALNGDVLITGKIFTSGSCKSGCATTPSAGEKRVRLFTPQESLPTIEDFGKAQLVNGRTYVRIDAAFANTMDDDAAYMVFITPEGDSNGLYVVNKTSGGFEVRENKSGRSTLAFSYRIVAKPFGQHAARLQMITVSRPGTSLPLSRKR
jgi:hypothetical protein